MADAFPIARLHHTLDALAARYCPVLARFGASYHWSLMQGEYTTDLIFHRQDELRPRYETLVLVRTAVPRGEWQISGFRNSSLRRVLPQYSGPQLSRLLKRLHVHGLIKTVGHTYKYYLPQLTQTGQQVVLTALKLRELVVIPSLAGLLPAAA